MQDEHKRKALNAFELRAEKYIAESKWISNIDFIQPLVPMPYAANDFLDICAGTGAVSEYAKTIGWNVTAVDISPTMLKYVSNDIRTVVADAEELPFCDKTFDVVSCRQGLQYVDLNTTLHSMVKIARSKLTLGHITLWDEKDLDFWQNYYLIASSGRKNVFTPNLIENLFKKKGYYKIKTEVKVSKDRLLNPVGFLDKESMDLLVDMIMNASESFKKRNHIQLIDNTLYSERRWEFITVDI